MRRFALLIVLALTITGCGFGQREMNAVKQAVRDNEETDEGDISCSKEADRRYQCTTEAGGDYAVVVQYNELGDGNTSIRITGMQP